MITRKPGMRLAPYVALIWASNGMTSAVEKRALRERVLPTGGVHLAFRLDRSPLRLITPDASGAPGRPVDIAPCVVGGARCAPYIKDTSHRPPTIGMLLRPGAARLLFGVPAHELAGAHTDIGLLWPHIDLRALCEELAEISDLSRRLAVFEDRFPLPSPAGTALPRLITHALKRFGDFARVGTVVAETGVSHRHFTQNFADFMGLSPKAYCRVLRFNRAIDLIAPPVINPDAINPDWADLAADAGYADQAHMIRDFRTIAGLTPTQYHRLRTDTPRHLGA